MRSSWRTVRRPLSLPGAGRIGQVLSRATVRDIALVCVADAVVGVSFGALATAGGMRPWLPVVMSLLVFAGGAQFAAVGILLAGGGAVAAVAAALILNGRLLPYSLSVADVLDGRWWRRIFGAHIVTDESVAFALRQDSPARRRAAFWLSGLGLFATWNVAVLVGAVAGASIGNTASYGLDSAFPAVAIALVLPSLRDRGTRHAALTGAALAVAATPFLPAGVPVLLALAGLLLLLRHPASPSHQTPNPSPGPARSADGTGVRPMPGAAPEPGATPAPGCTPGLGATPCFTTTTGPNETGPGAVAGPGATGSGAAGGPAGGPR
jgi:4-azaleucine resistance transporter AzlC